MLKKILATLLALFAAAAFAAVDVNKATQAELEGVKGIGPAISSKIIEERGKGPFKDWNDMVDRVKGVGTHNAAKFSAEGMTVNGAAYAGAPAAESKKTDKASDKKAPKPAATTAAATPAVTPAPAAAPASAAMSAADKKAAAQKAKDDKKAAKAAAKAEAKAAKETKASASAPAAAASAAKK